MTEQLNQVYAYLLKIEEASRKDVTGIQFAFEAGGYAKAAMAICESALNWPNHSKVEVQAELKTGFQFGGIIEEPEMNDTYFYPYFSVIEDRFIPNQTRWEDRDDDNILLHKGSVLLYEDQCQNYCDYLNSLTNEKQH